MESLVDSELAEKKQEMEAVMAEVPARLGDQEEKSLYPSMPVKRMLPSVERKVDEGIANAKYNY